MKKSLLTPLFFVVLIFTLSAQPQRELRSVWLTSVFNIDWPHSTLATASQQQARLISILNQLQAANFNAVMFQVRPNADALYKSSFEPWSHWITGTRGQVPLYDPLAFLIQEANKRGIEVHAWLNPYRFENTAGQFAGRPGDYSRTHPQLIINYNGKTYFDPGNPGTTQLIKRIVGDIISNYEVDGIIFDDYFYPSNLPASYDQATFDTWGTREFVSQWYNVTGTLPTRGDFRRASVNNMIREVNDTIKKMRPGVIFGVSPAGIYSTQASAAAHWGTTLPAGISGNDNYNTINCDPLAWLRDQSVDYISPQLYWVIGGAQDFVTLTQWWAKEAKRHNRHHYPSLGSYRLFGQKSLEIVDMGITGAEFGSWALKAESAEKFNWPLSEIGNQIIANRNNPNNTALGLIFYNTNSTVNSAKNLATYLAGDLFYQKAIFPVMEWLRPLQSGAPLIAEIGVAGGMETGIAALSVSATQTRRFLLYGSDDVTKTNAAEGDFLQVIFGRDFAPFYHKNKKYFTVQEFMPNRELGEMSASIFFQNLDPARVIGPFAETICDNAEFSWEPVTGAQSYQVQVAHQQNPSVIVYTSPRIEGTTFSMPQSVLAGQSGYVYRVKAMAGRTASWSSAAGFTTGQPLTTQINTPANNAINVSINPALQWNSVAGISFYQVQIATDPSFAPEFMVVDRQPVNLNLFTATLQHHNTRHFARVRAANNCGMAQWSPVISFTTVLGTFVDKQAQFVLRSYPNPTNNTTTIHYPVLLGQRNIIISDANGRFLRQFSRNNVANSDIFEMGQFESGLYIIRIETPKGQRFVSRVVKSN